jgi:SpoIID/LytB domain protein
LRVLPRLIALVALSAGLLVTGVAPPAAAWPTSTVEFRGHGWGHGRGMGQWGSLGYAVDHGWSHAQILAHFYGGTTRGTRGNEVIGVRLDEHNSTPAAPKPMTVTSASTFSVGSHTFTPGQYARVRHTSGGWVIERGTSCGGPWVPVQSGISTSVWPTAGTAYAGDDIRQMINVCGAGLRAYRGTVEIRVVDVNFIRVINRVPMEQYLRGVVPRESPASWADAGGGRGLQALKAQSVAARSYAFAENRNPVFKTCDTISCQVYGGAGLNGQRIEDARTDRAIAETAGEVRVHGDGRIARTEFSSSTGGYTAGGTFPAVPDAGDATASNPHRNWVAQVPVATVEARFPAIGTLQRFEVVERNGLGQNGGRVRLVRLTGTSGSTTVSGDQLRSVLGLKSDWFRVIDPSLNSPAVGAARSGSGLVLTSTSGEAMGFRGGETFGSMEGIPLPRPVVAIATTPSGKGYWLVGTSGCVYAFGDAREHGSMCGRHLNQPIVGMAGTRTGNGYYLVASDGGIFTFGDARLQRDFAGRVSMGGTRLNQPVVGMALSHSGNGYFLVARDGGIFTFGDARFQGSTGNIRLNQPIVGMTVDPQGRGYWHVAADGGVFTFPQGRPFLGSLGNRSIPAPIVGLVATATGDGYWLVGRDGAIYRFGDAT